MNIRTFFSHAKLRCLSLSCLLLFGAGCATTPMTTTRQHPELEQRLAQIKTIAILPVEVAFLHKTVSGDELQPEKERELQLGFMTTLGRMVEFKRYQVIRMEVVSDDTMKASTPEIKQVREEVASLSAQVSQSVPVTEATLSAAISGSVVQSLANAQKADALLVARYSGHDSSGGLTATRLLTAGIVGGLTGHTVVPSSAAGVCNLMLVDGKNGDVLWTNSLAGSTDRKRTQYNRPGYYGPSDLVLNAIRTFPEKPAGP